MGILQRQINIYNEFIKVLKEINWSEERIATTLSEIEKTVKGNEQSRMTIEELEQQILSCRACYKQDLVTEHGPVCGRGTKKDIDILFVGQMPGETEEKTKKVFSGPNSSVLVQAMADLNIGLPNCPAYLHNLVCCKPLGDKPKVAQVNNCSLFLSELIWILQPNLIVTLGTAALSFLMGKTAKIEDFEGEVLIQGRYIIVPLKHPSAIHRIPDKEEQQKAMVKYKEQITGIYKMNSRIKKLRASGEIPQKEVILDV